MGVSASSNYDIGHAIGSHFKIMFRQVFERMFSNKILNPDSPFNGMSIIEIVLSFVDSDPATFYDPFYNATNNYFPHYIEELKGIADGADVPFKYVL